MYILYTTRLERPKARPTAKYTDAIGSDGFSPANHAINGFDGRSICKANRFANNPGLFLIVLFIFI